MAGKILVKDQKKIPFQPLSMAQLNDALDTYRQNEEILTGLNAIKEAKAEEMSSWYNCAQCLGIGTIDDKANTCPLCKGEGKTEKMFTPDRGPVISFNEVEII